MIPLSNGGLNAAMAVTHVFEKTSNGIQEGNLNAAAEEGSDAGADPEIADLAQRPQRF
jgi:hypothetical protein